MPRSTPKTTRQIASKFSGKCTRCAKAYKVGDQILWAPNVKGAAHVNCATDARESVRTPVAYALDLANAADALNTLENVRRAYSLCPCGGRGLKSVSRNCSPTLDYSDFRHLEIPCSMDPGSVPTATFEAYAMRPFSPDPKCVAQRADYDSDPECIALEGQIYELGCDVSKLSALARPMRGDTVQIDRPLTRGKNATDAGVTGIVVWVGEQDTYAPRYVKRASVLRAGIKLTETDRVIYIDVDRVTVIERSIVL